MPDPNSQSAASRVDPAHAVLSRASVKSVAASPVGAEDAGGPSSALPLDSRPPVETHAAQLAERLQRQQEALDQRSAELDLREADLEAKVESARLWFEQQIEEIEQRPIEPKRDSLDEVAAEKAQQKINDRLAEIDAREKSLDCRQAELYQQIEELTAQRGKHADRVAELDVRQQKLEKLAEEMLGRESQAATGRAKDQQQEADFARQKAELETQQQELDNLGAELAARESQLSARQAEIQLAIKRYEGLQITERRISEAQRAGSESAARSRHLDEAERMLSEEKEALERQCRQLNADRQAHQQQRLIERRKIEEERAISKQDLAHNEEILRQRSERIEQREAALERLQVELQASQREVLEMRLATEETWAQLTGALAPASLTRSIAQVRGQLADHYEQTLREMEERRLGLEEVAQQLADEQTRLETHGRELQGWVKRRDEEIEKQAARLIARERELDRQQRQYEELEARWNRERNELRSRIRELLAAIRHDEASHELKIHAA
jgi:chromosome segregation ATPase